MDCVYIVSEASEALKAWVFMKLNNPVNQIDEQRK